MSVKTLDQQGRWRNKVVAFRMSPEEDEILEAKVRMSGLTKQEYIIRRLHENEIVVKGNPRVFRALKHQAEAILTELQRIEAGQAVPDDLMELMEFMTTLLEGMKDDGE